MFTSEYNDKLMKKTLYADFLKKTIIVLAGVLCINLLAFGYFALVFYPVQNKPGIGYWFMKAGYYLFRVALCVAFGWAFAWYNHKDEPMCKHGVSKRFIRQTRILLAIAVVLWFWLYVVRPHFVFKLQSDLLDYVWDYFTNPGMFRQEHLPGYILMGQTFSPIAQFISESFLLAAPYVSLLMAYLSYSFRVALHPSKPEDSAAPLAEHA